MTIRDDFIDAMSMIDEDLITSHIRKKHPTKAQRIHRYVMAAGIYAAAILVVAVILPFVIGHGEDPKPVPGNDPVTVETVVREPDDPEVRQINVTDIDARYNGTDPENLSDKVALDEVKAIISAARQAYAEYDVIVLTDGTLLPTKAKLQDYTLEQLEELAEDKRDTLYEEYSEYFESMFTVIEEMLDLRFPENSILREADPEDYGLPRYYALNLPDTGFSTAEELIDAEKDSNAIYAEWILTNLMKSKTVYYFDSNTAEEDIELLYPTAGEFEIWQAVEVWRMMGEVPETDDGIDTDINFDADIESIVVGIGGKTLTIDKDSEYYERIMILANEMISAGAQEMTDAPAPDIAGIKQYEAFAEIVYNREVDVLTGEESVMSKRILFSLIGYNAPAMILSEDDGYTNIRMYSVSMSDGMIAAVRDMIYSDETTPAETTAPAPETTTPPPAVQPAVTATTTTTAPEPVAENGNNKETTNTTTKEPSVTTTRKPVTTTQKVTYPDPYISNETATSVTRTFYGCDYTLSVDKAKCEPGDIITVTVTLENKGQSRIDLYDYYYSYDRYNGITHKNFLDRVAFKVSGFGAFDYSGEGYTKRTPLMPGKTMSYTTKIDTTDADVRSSWAVCSEIYFTVDGEMKYQYNSLQIEHDGCVNWPSFVDGMYNPFDHSEYENMFKGNGEIVITFSPEASGYWEKYLGPEYFGYYGILDPGSDSPEYSSKYDPYEIEEITIHEDTDGPGVTVSIFLKDKDEMNVNSAVSFLHQISEENDGAIVHAYPVEANYFVK